MTTLYGTVNPNGQRAGGSAGWTVRQDGEGMYLIVFEPAFPATPVSVVTQVYPNDLANNGGDTRDNAVIIGQDNNELKVKTGDGNGGASNRWFNFVTVG